MSSKTPSQSSFSYEAIKLGINAHARYYWVSRQVDGATPQPVQKMTYDELLLFVVLKQQRLTGKVVGCYEAGAFGFHLHRRFEELGIQNYVAHPQDLDEFHGVSDVHPHRINQAIALNAFSNSATAAINSSKVGVSPKNIGPSIAW